ncbi:type VI secretion system contractile sheath small subunit [Enterobacteriaceae bacterium ESL0689]|nr:type VI secretion system contractile sheath small subunit [Enterobacteriaceae bacterium ESL0689]
MAESTFQSEIPKARVNTINKLNFDKLLSEWKPEISYSVLNMLTGDGSEENIRLIFFGIKDGEPEAIAKQIPPLRAMLAMRNLLRDLKSHLMDNTGFRKLFESVLKAPALRKGLKAALNALVSAE